MIVLSPACGAHIHSAHGRMLMEDIEFAYHRDEQTRCPIVHCNGFIWWDASVA